MSSPHPPKHVVKPLVLQYICLMFSWTDLIDPKPQDHSPKLAPSVPFKVAINISSTDRLVQIASYMPERQLHLHSCNNELMNPALLEKAEGLESIGMDLRGKGLTELDSLHSLKSFPKFEFIWMSMGSLRDPSSRPAQSVLQEVDRSS